MMVGSLMMFRMFSSVLGPVKKVRVKVSELGFSAVLIIHRRGRNTNAPMSTRNTQKKMQNPMVF